MRTSQFSEEQIIGRLRLAEAGQTVAEGCRQHGISEGSYSRWKAQSGGVEVSQRRRLRQLDEENRRLKQIVADRGGSDAGHHGVERARHTNRVTPPARRAAGGHLPQTYAMSPRRACRRGAAHRRTMRSQRRTRSDAPAVRERRRSLAAERPRGGSRRRHVLLRRERGPINHQRVQRLSRLEGLAIRRRKRKRVARIPRGMGTQMWQPGEAWAVDFMQDVLADGRRVRTLHVRDRVTRECLAIEVDTSLPGQRVVRLLGPLIPWQGIPKQSTLDKGPECTGQALDVWADEHSVQLDCIDPGRPMHNG